MNNYQYPLNLDWTTDEIIEVVHCLSLVEQAYDQGVQAEVFGDAYKGFKQIVTSIAEEKQIDRQFKAVSGFSLYQVVKQWKSLDSHQKIVMK